MINPINSDQLVKSVQRDYRHAADNHRMRRQLNQDGSDIKLVKVGLALTSLAGLVIVLSLVVG